MISVRNIRRACLAALDRHLEANRATYSEEDAASAALEMVQFFHEPDLFIANRQLEVFTGVDKQTGTPCFLLDLDGSRALTKVLERRLRGVDMSGAMALITAGLTNQPPKYDMLQQVEIANENQYRGVVNKFSKMARQSKSQAMYEEVRGQLVSATEVSVPLGKAVVHDLINNNRGSRGQQRPRVRMFLALDFEWWEKSSETILEVGWSLWDTLTQRHRSRHWIIRENLNKHNGQYISDNRMNFVFGTSERGSLERAFDALQAEIDVRGVTDGLTRQQKDLLEGCDIDVVLVGHALSQDQEHAELFEIEWPEGMVTFDTQKLFVAFQLEQMDKEAADRALEWLSKSSRAATAAGLKPTTLELVDQYEETALDGSDDEDGGYGVPDDLDSDDSDYGLPGAITALSLAKKAKNRPTSAGSGGSGSRIAAVQPAKPKAVQGPVRVRPWPAGPLPSEREERDGGGSSSSSKQQREQQQSAPKDKINKQVGLGPMLAELKIRSQRLHNAGNDARFTMEAFLALTGHPVCSDPAAAHNNALLSDPRYKQQLEASIQAAAEQGWGAPTPVQPLNKRGKPYSPAHSGGGAVGGGGGFAGTSPSSSAGAGGGGGRGRGGGGGGGRGGGSPAPAAAAAAISGGGGRVGGGAGPAWGGAGGAVGGRPASGSSSHHTHPLSAQGQAAAGPAGGGRGSGGWASVVGAGNRGQAAAPAAPPQQRHQPPPQYVAPANSYLANPYLTVHNPYQPNEDSW